MNAVLELLRPTPADIAADDVLPAVLKGVRTTPDRRVLRRRITAASLITYVLSSLWMLYGLGFAIGDALSRSANARAIWYSRRPTLSAMGFAWLPGPVLFQSIFAALLEPLGRSELSGPLATSVLGAATVHLLVTICTHRGLSATWTVLFVSAYAFNPVIVFTASNGMSEQMYLFFLVLLAHGFLRWCDHPSIGALTVTGFALAGAMAVRYESFVLVVFVAFFVGMRRAAWRERLQSALLVAAPPVFVLGVWLLANKLIQGAWLWFLHPAGSGANASNGNPPSDAFWLPAKRTFRTAIEFSLSRTWALTAIVLLLVPLLLARRRGKRLAGMGLVAMVIVSPLWIIYLLPQNRTWGNPRYFLPMAAIAAVALIWLAADRGSRVFGHPKWGNVARMGLIAAMLFTAVNGTFAESRKNVAAVESEWYVFQSGLGQSELSTGVSLARRWSDASAQVDTEIGKRPHSLVMISFGQSFPLFLFTDHPKQYMIDTDLEYQPTLSANGRNIDYVFLPTGSAGALNGLVGPGWIATVNTPAGVLWKRA
jgi:hypothetical protein